MSKHRNGFTILEIMVVIVLISLMAGIVSSKIMQRFRLGKIKIAAMMVRSTLPQALNQFYLDHDAYPTSDEGLRALVEPPEVEEGSGLGLGSGRQAEEDGYAEEEQLADPWGRPYQYECPGTHNPRKYDLWSMGPDRRSGTDDDIGNWK